MGETSSPIHHYGRDPSRQIFKWPQTPERVASIFSTPETLVDTPETPDLLQEVLVLGRRKQKSPETGDSGGETGDSGPALEDAGNWTSSKKSPETGDSGLYTGESGPVPRGAGIWHTGDSGAPHRRLRPGESIQHQNSRPRVPGHPTTLVFSSFRQYMMS